MIRALLMEARVAGRALTASEDVDRLSGNVLRDAIRRMLGSDGELPLFLLRTSVADVLTESLAERLSGSERVESHLERVEQLAIASWIEDRDAPAPRYHDLVRRVLREQAADRLADELPTLHTHIARWELAEGRSVAAFRHALASGDDELASRVAMLRWPELMVYRQGPRDRLLEIPVARMPPAVPRRAAGPGPQRRPVEPRAGGGVTDGRRRHRGLPDLVRPSRTLVALTEREEVVLRELVTLPYAADIAAALEVSANTVRSQLRSVYRKLGVGSREEALAAPLCEGLLYDDQ